MVFTVDQKKEQEEAILALVVSKGGCVEEAWIYQDSGTKIQVKCKEGHQWGVLPGSLRKGNWCRECDGQVVHESTVRDLIVVKGGKLDPDWKYLNSKTKFWVECKEGHRWETYWDTLRKCWCPYCVGHTVSEESLRVYIKNKGGKLDPNWKYTHYKSEFFLTCDKGHRWETCWNVVQSGHWCPQCAKDRADEKRAEDRLECESVVRKFVANKEGKLDVGWSYVNNNTKIWVECKRHHRWEATWQNLKDRGSWCPQCAGRFVEEETVRAFIENKGGKISENWVYVSAKTKFGLKCSEGHHFESCWDKIRAEHWCPDCRTTKTENEFRVIMERVFSGSFPKTKPEWLKNPVTRRLLELDGYSQEKKIAFEYQGPLHYEKGWFSSSGLEKQKERDKIKVLTCFINKVALIVIPHWIPKKNWEIEIKNQYNKLQEVL